MANYLGNFEVDIQQTEFRDYTPTDWALYYIHSYGQIDGAHHKQWVLDQIVRILKGTKVNVVEARWDNGETELRVSLDEPSLAYHLWIKNYKAGEDGPETYDYDEGIAP